MQKSQILRLKEENKGNLLYQCGFKLGLSLEDITGFTEEEALTSLPSWIILTHMTQCQLQILAADLGVPIPNTCTKTRKSLADLLVGLYSRWEGYLKTCSTTSELRKYFKGKCGQGTDINEVRAHIKREIKIIIPGEEIIYMWVTTDNKGFCPILFRTPGPTTNKKIITS